jgi:protein-tyrosine-phosphatase
VSERQPSAVLFCCTMNSVRSPMAAAILSQRLGRRIWVDSCGVRERDVDGYAIAVMEEVGIDIRRHISKTFEDLDDTSFDLVISLSPEAQHKAVEMTRTMACDVEFWRTFDPTLIEGSRDEKLAAYRAIRDELMERIAGRFPVPGESADAGAGKPLNTM